MPRKNKISLNLLQFDSNPTASLLEGVVGQEPVVNKLNFYIKSHNNGDPIPTLLFSGSHGLGKTFITEKFAKALKRKYVEINCASLTNVEKFMNLMIKKVGGKDGATILLDESHALKKDVTDFLLSILNPNEKSFSTVNFKGIDVCFDLNKMNFIFATTDAYKMFKPLKSRCEIVYFHPYHHDEIIDMLKLYMPDIKVECDIDDLVYACRNRGRDTFLLTQNLGRHLNNDNVLTKKLWDEFKSIFDLFPMGLKLEEYKLLKVISDNQPISCGNLALKLMVNEDNIKEEIEIRLRELGLIESTTRGRILTEDGERYIEEMKK